MRKVVVQVQPECPVRPLGQAKILPIRISATGLARATAELIFTAGSKGHHGSAADLQPGRSLTAEASSMATQRQIRTRRNLTMSLVSLVVTLIVVGVLLWLINTYIPMDAKIKSILNSVVVVVVVLWLLNLLGLMDSLRGIRIGR
jgi:hypothetical protein